MRDPHVHAEKTITPGFGQVAMADFIASATGLAPDLPKTTGTGCGRRRQLADTSTVPEHVTCLPCRDWAARQQIEAAGMAQAVIPLGDDELAALATSGKDPLTVARLNEIVRDHYAMARRYGWSPETDKEAG